TRFRPLDFDTYNAWSAWLGELPATQHIADFGQLDRYLGILVLAAVMLDRPAPLVACRAQRLQARFQRVLCDLPGDMCMHGPRRHERIAVIPAEVQEHAKAGVVHRLTQAPHVFWHHLRAPVVFGADFEAALVGALGILPVALDDPVEL